MKEISKGLKAKPISPLGGGGGNQEAEGLFNMVSFLLVIL